MFTLTQIKDAHSNVRSGTDFPQYIQDLVALGVLKYVIYVCDGHAEYIGKENFSISSSSEYSVLQVSEEINIDKFKHYLKMHQEGKSDYPTFCENSAETGVEKWIVDLTVMSCTYLGKLNNVIYEEKISI